MDEPGDRGAGAATPGPVAAPRPTQAAAAADAAPSKVYLTVFPMRRGSDDWRG
jgi:hypothetical protein